jgi:hypothetical protein
MRRFLVLDDDREYHHSRFERQLFWGDNVQGGGPEGARRAIPPVWRA